MSAPSTDPSKGRLYLVPSPLDFSCTEAPELQATLQLGSLQHAAALSHWICENAKSARAYLKRINAIVPLCQPIQLMSLVELPDNNYMPRADDPRAGYGGPQIVDYSAPVGEPMVLDGVAQR